jgi:hypothetical protein
MSRRLIDTTIHELTSQQVLEQVLRFCAESTEDPIVIVTERGKADQTLAAVRTVLSQQRRKYINAGHKPKQFGFETVSGPESIRLHDEDLEIIGIKYKVSARQQFINLAASDFDFSMEPSA